MEMTNQNKLGSINSMDTLLVKICGDTKISSEKYMTCDTISY